MTFSDDGSLEYVIHTEQTDQKVFLVYRIEGDSIVSNQPSSPRVEVTSYSFDGEELVLEYAGHKDRFRRVGE